MTWFLISNRFLTLCWSQLFPPYTKRDGATEIRVVWSYQRTAKPTSFILRIGLFPYRRDHTFSLIGKKTRRITYTCVVYFEFIWFKNLRARRCTFKSAKKVRSLRYRRWEASCVYVDRIKMPYRMMKNDSTTSQLGVQGPSLLARAVLKLKTARAIII